MWQLFIVTFFYWWEIQLWSSLIYLDPFWTDIIRYGQNKLTMFILMVNVTILNCNIFLTGENSNLIKFGPFWSILDRSDPIWSKKFIIKDKKIIRKDYYFVKCGKSGKFGLRYQEKHVKSLRCRELKMSLWDVSKKLVVFPIFIG